MKKALSKTGRAIKSFFLGLGTLIKEHVDARDLHAYAGIILLAVGCGMIYRPAGYIAAGIMLLFIALRR